MLKASKSVSLSLSILKRPGLATSPNIETVRFMNSTVTTGSFTRFFETSSSFIYEAISSRVIPATWMFPNTGKSMSPFLFIVYPDIPWLLDVPDFVPICRDMIGRLKRSINKGSLLLTNIETLSSGRTRISSEFKTCSAVPGFKSVK